MITGQSLLLNNSVFKKAAAKTAAFFAVRGFSLTEKRTDDIIHFNGAKR